MRIAYFSPLRPRRSGIADYSEELLPYLARHARLDLFVDGYRPCNAAIVRRFEVFDVRSFPQLRHRRRYDVRLYHMGDSLDHTAIYRTLRRFPGVTVLHDCVLHPFFKTHALMSGRPAAYLREMGYCYGRHGMDVAYQALSAGPAFSEFDWPLTDRVLDASLGVIVHSEYARRQVARTHPNLPVARVNHHLSPRALTDEAIDPARLRASLGLASGQFIVASFGRMEPHKHLDVALRGFARLRRTHPEAIYLLVGETPEYYNPGERAQALGVRDAVRITGHVSLGDLHRFMAAADVGINLRHPTAGETSGSVVRMLGAGKPVIVSDVGAFSEMPDDCCLKVPVGAEEEDLLLEHLLTLAGNADLRRRIGESARRHVRRHHRIEDSAQAYAAFVARCLQDLEHPGARPRRLSMGSAAGRTGTSRGSR